MGALQPGLPLPMAIPQGTFKIIIDLKNCFYTIPLTPQDCQRFAFSVPSTNYEAPMQRYQWLVLPQWMANRPTLYQKFVAQALNETRKKFPQVYIIHYMDDILLAHSDEGTLLSAFAIIEKGLTLQGLKIAPEKVQRFHPYSYLGFKLTQEGFQSQKIEIRKDSLKTLNDFQKLLGDIN